MKTAKTKRILRWAARGIVLFFILLLLGAAAAALLFVYYAKDLPRPEKFLEKRSIQSTKIYDRTGQTILYEMYSEEKREIVPLSAIPIDMQRAVIATEDANFYKNPGIDLRAIVRAILTDIKLRRPAEGASTITQQLVRSSLLTSEKTIRRKVREIILTLELAKQYSKDQILELYLNQIPFGSNAYGVEAASNTYFNKSAKNLTLSECAILAAMIKAPSYYSPYGQHQAELQKRKDYVLGRMEQEHYITKERSERAKKDKIDFVKITQNIKAPHFVMYVRDYLIDKYGEDYLQERGLKVYTTLDLDLQEQTEKIIKDGAKANEIYGSYNAALVAINPQNGEILSLIGSKDWFGDPEPKGCQEGENCLFDPKFDVATLGERQPGSSFKPFVYATAFKNGSNDTTIVIDAPTDFGVWGGEHYTPQNYDGLFRGPVTLRQALAQSLNVPSVKVLNDLAGLEDSIKTAQAMGIMTLVRPASFYGLSLVLGGGEVRLLDMVSAYGVFANDGLRVPPNAILRIEDNQGNILEETRKEPKRIFESGIAQLISDILSDNSARSAVFGSNSPLYFPKYKVSVKTGTTSNYKDGWTIGYTPSIVIGLWSGNNNAQPARKDPAVVSVAPMWHQAMDYYLTKHPDQASIYLEPSPEISLSPQ